MEPIKIGPVGWDDVQVCVAVDLARADQGLPYEPTHPDHRGS